MVDLLGANDQGMQWPWDPGTVESGYLAHLVIKRTFAIRRMPSSGQNLHKALLTGAVF